MTRILTTRFGAVAVLAAALVAAACSPTPSPTASVDASPGSSVGTGSTLTVGLAAEAESLDPALVYQSAGQSVMFAIFDTLLTINPDGSLGPGLAESWDVVGPTTIELKLRTGITFHGGEEPFDAEAVRISIYRVMDLDPATGEPITDDAARLNSQWSRDFASVDEVEIVDATTVKIHLKNPDAAILNALGRTFIVPPEYVGRVGNDGFAQAPIGTGPFVFEERVKDDRTTVTKNPSYWDSPRGRPLVDTVVFRPIPDAATRLNELVTGGVDLIADPSPDQLDRIEEAEGRVPTMPDARRYLIWFSIDGKGALAEDPNKTEAQATALAALAKPEVRLALNLAVDRQAIIDTLLQERGAKMTGPFVEGDLGFDPALPAFPYDPDRASQLLADAGYPDGFEVDLDICTCDRTDLPEAVAGELAKIGVTVNLKPFEISQFNADWGAGRQNPMRASRLSFSDVNVYLQLWLRTGGFLSRFSDAEVDNLIDAQAAEYDSAARETILRSIGERVREAAPALFLWSSPNLYGAAKSVPGWQPHLLGYLPVVGVEVVR
ncbi:MAG TPA: ABC transporter substrate-binding protein [Candidatus Limnocylindrales bacterium]|nr:ABC transporter substrate-binding protein [Candidatus Limnocylindrales bacterium]